MNSLLVSLLFFAVFSSRQVTNGLASGNERTFFIPLPFIPIPRPPQPVGTGTAGTGVTTTTARVPITTPSNSVCNSRCCRQYCSGSTLCDVSSSPFTCMNNGVQGGTLLSCLNNNLADCAACPITATCSLSCGDVLGQSGAQLAFCAVP